MIILVNEYCFFDRHKIGSVFKFQRYLGVKHNSYAGTVARRLYFQYFGDSHNLHRYYKKYYRKEFCSCVEFLECRLMIEHDLAESISKGNLSFASFKSKSDGIKYSFDYDENLVNLFREYVGGIKNESANRVRY